MLPAAAYLGLLDLKYRVREAMLMAGALAVTLMGILTIDAFAQALDERYAIDQRGLLVAAAQDTIGEMQGSRLPAAVGDLLLAGGASFTVPQVRTIVGTSAEDARLLRGVPLESYERVEPFRIVSGRALAPGDSPRQTMIGVSLAETLGLTVGGDIRLRGRTFEIVGIFTEGSYADFEAWVSLESAQALLNWGDDVSVFLLPAGERWQVGDRLGDNVMIAPHGQSAEIAAAEWAPLLDLMRLIAGVLAFSATVALASLIWRMARLRRRQLAILLSLGFTSGALSVYVVTQAAVMAAVAYSLGVIGAVLFTGSISVQSIGMSLEPTVSVQVAGLGLLFAVIITVLGAAAPAYALARSDLQQMLRQAF
jgi:hypothetical protein